MLSVEQNNLIGAIPSSIGKLKSLTFLALGTKNLVGTIPPSIYNLSSIRNISVLDNLLDGTLPFGLGLSIFRQLDTFHFHMNQFSGEVPVTISNASHLSEFGISQNNFTGKVPSMKRMKNLYRLAMDNNNLGYGDDDLGFVSSLVNSTKLDLLGFSGNMFRGVLPEFISNLSTNLKGIRLGRNQIRGSIPIGIGNLINLDIQDLEANLLTGPMPSSIGKVHKLYNLFLNHNQLSGTIPSSLGNLTSLSRLVLSSNNLQGGIPETLGECKYLQVLDLSQNNRSGLIPPEILSSSSLSEALDLSSNHFIGPIPVEVGRLVNLVLLDVSENKLSGLIPWSLGNCKSLETLHLEGNLLEETIPTSLKEMRGIEDLDFSRNKLSGRIDAFGGFQVLNNLNLSFNDFYGAVPLEEVFQNSSAVSFMGNTRLCGGVPNLRLPRYIPNDSEEEIIPRVKIVISVACGGTSVIIVLCIVLIIRSRKALWISLVHQLSLVKLRKALCLVAVNLRSSSLRVLHLKVSYGDLLKATDGFSSQNLIGSGSFGFVYRGILHQEDRIVAVTVLNVRSSRESFIAECEALKCMRHRNLVKLLTACASIDFKALVYEFMMNGSLEEWLHNSADRAAGAPVVLGYLNLIQRVNIAIDIASALDYMHNFYHKILIQNDQGQRVEECLVSIAMIGVACSVELPKARMEIGKVLAELHLIRDVLTGTRMPREHMITIT